MLTVEIWSDVMCPWCYLGKLNWRAALARCGFADDVRTVWRSFELRPHLPQGKGDRLAVIMRRDWHMSETEIESVFTDIRTKATAAGVHMAPEKISPVNSFDAHRLLHSAAERGVEEALLDRLFAAYHAEAADLSDHAVLRELAAGAGLPAEDVDDVLGSTRYAAEVRADERTATEVGVTAVPSYRLGDRRAMSGALDVDRLVTLLREANQPTAG